MTKNALRHVNNNAYRVKFRSKESVNRLKPNSRLCSGSFIFTKSLIIGTIKLHCFDTLSTVRFM